MKHFKAISLLILLWYLGVLIARTKSKEMTESLNYRSVNAKRITKRPKKRQNKERKFKKKVWRVCCKKFTIEKMWEKYGLTKEKKVKKTKKWKKKK